jgi:Fe-S cluster biogenesis protein NfuA/nitrite reductase/ring-hydroxylating ferredoxin subunit
VSAGPVSASPVPEPGGRPDPRATGERIEVLLEAAAAGGAVARERAEELVRLVADLYGAGLERLLEIAYDCGRLDDELLDRLAADDLVAGLLAVHGGDVEFLGITEDGVARLRMLGSCDGCPSSSVTLTLAVETAIRAAAPEVTGIEVEEAPTASPSVIPVSALRSRLGGPAEQAGTGTAVSWAAVEELGSLLPGELVAFAVAGMSAVGTRVGDDLYAYRDRCPLCEGSLADGTVGRRLGGAAGDAVLRCPTCSGHYDVRHAGRGLDGTGAHLEPVPLLIRDGVASVAVAGAVGA